MAAKPETTFTKRITSKLPRDIYVMKNNNSYTGGIPDLWISGNHSDLWAEMKYLPKIPTRAIVDPKKLLSSLQLQWLNNRNDEGRHVCVIIGCPAGGVVLQNKVWEMQMTASEYKDQIITHAELTRWIERKVSTR